MNIPITIKEEIDDNGQPCFRWQAGDHAGLSKTITQAASDAHHALGSIGKNSHTPGPWSIQADPEYIGGHPYHQNRYITCGRILMTDERWESKADAYIIATMRDCQNQQANARLIAAAPYLLEACQHAINVLGPRMGLVVTKMMQDAVNKATT